jgi:DNA-binding LacI/PurR family transcriptional regulator
MVTLKDIAKEAGVSAVTVSNVINGNYKKVSAENVARINEIVQRMHYVPNATARSLVRRESHIIGVLIPNVGDHDNFLQSPYNAEILGVLERSIRNVGYYLMVRCLNDYSQAFPLLHSWNVDGAVFLGATQADVEALDRQLNIPAVYLDTYTDRPVCGVGADDFRGGYIATKYLVNNGHRHICFLAPGYTGDGVIARRYKGYLQAMAEAGLEKYASFEQVNNTTFESGVQAGKKLAFAPETTACFTTADILGIGLMQGLRLSGKQVPEDISIVGYDNLPDCRFTTPQLTTIDQHIVEKAELAAESLLKMLRGDHSASENTLLPVELIERQSVKRIGR